MIRQTHQQVDDRNIVTSEEQDDGSFETVAKFLSYLILILTFPVSIFLCLIIVAEFERAVIFRLGRLMKGGARGPGLVFVLPCIDDYFKLDLRTSSFDIPPQEILTKDSVTIKVDAVVYFRIEDPLKAVIQIENYRFSTQLLSQTTLRNVAGTKMLVELLTEKDELSQEIQKIIDEATAPWGVKVERVEIKDVRLPYELQRAMAAEAEAVREAKAKIVAAEGEKNASKSLKEASDVMALNPIALQLRYLQTLSSISSERNSTVIFPFPIDLLSGFSQAKSSPKDKDVSLPYELQRAMAAEAEAIRGAKAKIVAAEGEKNASKSLKEASDVMALNPIALQLRYLQTLSSITAERNSTIIFPFPINLMGGFNIQAKPKANDTSGSEDKVGLHVQNEHKVRFQLTRIDDE